jgi:hypothetical protein
MICDLITINDWEIEKMDKKQGNQSVPGTGLLINVIFGPFWLK